MIKERGVVKWRVTLVALSIEVEEVIVTNLLLVARRGKLMTMDKMSTNEVNKEGMYYLKWRQRVYFFNNKYHQVGHVDTIWPSLYVCMRVCTLHLCTTNYQLGNER